jgi:hypothetical protein
VFQRIDVRGTFDALENGTTLPRRLRAIDDEGGERLTSAATAGDRRRQEERASQAPRSATGDPRLSGSTCAERRTLCETRPPSQADCGRSTTKEERA